MCVWWTCLYTYIHTFSATIPTVYFTSIEFANWMSCSVFLLNLVLLCMHANGVLLLPSPYSLLAPASHVHPLPSSQPTRRCTFTQVPVSFTWSPTPLLYCTQNWYRQQRDTWGETDLAIAPYLSIPWYYWYQILANCRVRVRHDSFYSVPWGTTHLIVSPWGTTHLIVSLGVLPI